MLFHAKARLAHTGVSKISRKKFVHNRYNVHCKGKGLPETGGYRVREFEIIYLIFICSDG
jgi:hypothetical protein